MLSNTAWPWVFDTFFFFFLLDTSRIVANACVYQYRLTSLLETGINQTLQIWKYLIIVQIIHFDFIDAASTVFYILLSFARDRLPACLLHRNAITAMKVMVIQKRNVDAIGSTEFHSSIFCISNICLMSASNLGRNW